jgi:RNA polymerase sigma-70 factor (ECF subfamily)
MSKASGRANRIAELRVMSSASRFERLALPQLEAAYNLAFWLTRSRPDADDIVQDAYVRALRAFDGFRGDDIKPWLLAIVRNVAYRWLANRQRARNIVSLEETLAGTTAESPMDQLASDEPSAEQMMMGAVERDYVLRALAELPPAFREVIVLREIEGLAYREIAEVTGTPVGTVMSRLARGRSELRKELKKLIEKDEPNAM